MSAIILTNIRCDACGRDGGHVPAGDSTRVALSLVREQGWRRVLNVRDGARRLVDVCDRCLLAHRAVMRPFDGSAATDPSILFEIDETELA